MIDELAADRLAWRCPDDWLPGDSSLEVPAATTIVGQDRAVEAIAFGLAMRGVGYNVFITGLSGTGRLTTIKSLLDQLADDVPAPDDVCFAFNARKPDEPTALMLKAGSGRRLRDGMDGLVRELADSLPGIFSDSELRRRVEAAVASLRKRERQLIESFDAEVRKKGFSLVQIQMGAVARPEVLPVVGEQPVPLDQLAVMVGQGEMEEAEADRLRAVHEKLAERLHDVFQSVAELRRQAQDKVEKTRREAIRPFLDVVVKRVRDSVGDERADSYLELVRQDLEDNIEAFESGDDESEEDRFMRWRVNLAVDNGELTGRPVILETEPTYSNLFGSIERTLTRPEESATSFLRIRAGSLLSANGGFLVISADDMLQDPRVWPALKRALKYRRVQIQSLESVILGAAALKPEPVPIRVKVVIIGSKEIYELVYHYDPDFSKVFKVLADFDTVMEPTAASARDILSVLRKVSDEEDLLPMDRGGMAAVLEEAVRAGRWRRRFSSRFSDLADMLREASFLAATRGAPFVGRNHVTEAQAAYRRRHGLVEDRTHDLVGDGLIRIVTEGKAVGQVNGLAVYDLGYHRFGRPSRISARVGLGREGVVNVERQAGLSGPTHDKGINILTGFLRGTFARTVPLSMTCSVTFEQSYGGIDGDSASSTEVYAILSALAEEPLRQDIAVTGSVDQYGAVQAIGGVNEKVEGFFRVCSDRGLTGSQGVMIPAANAADLQLVPDVVEAVRAGRFHLWAVDTIEEGIELLTGIPAGRRTETGVWDEGSLYQRCQRRLEEMTRLLRQAGREGAANGGGDA